MLTIEIMTDLHELEMKVNEELTALNDLLEQ